MLRAVSISLVLMGGGIVTAAAVHRHNDPCARDQAQMRPDVLENCVRSGRTSMSGGGGGHYSGSSSGYATAVSSSGSTTGAAAGATSAGSSSVARGGFGAAGAAHASGGGS